MSCSSTSAGSRTLIWMALQTAMTANRSLTVQATIVIGGIDTGVPNHLFDNGCTMSDLIADAAAAANNHGQFVSAVDKLTNS